MRIFNRSTPGIDEMAGNKNEHGRRHRNARRLQPLLVLAVILKWVPQQVLRH
jgi:hypothetical protein